LDQVVLAVPVVRGEHQTAVQVALAVLEVLAASVVLRKVETVAVMVLAETVAVVMAATAE
jgi:hypothetical protein